MMGGEQSAKDREIGRRSDEAAMFSTGSKNLSAQKMSSNVSLEESP